MYIIYIYIIFKTLTKKRNTDTNTRPLKVLCVSFDPRANDLLAASCLSGQILFWNVVTAQTVTW